MGPSFITHGSNPAVWICLRLILLLCIYDPGTKHETADYNTKINATNSDIVEIVT